MFKAKNIVSKYNLKKGRLMTVKPFIEDVYAELSSAYVGTFISLRNIEEVTDSYWNEITMVVCEVKAIGVFKWWKNFLLSR